jgi:LuxR family transcriptional regulator, regulator of acetate metabolism
MVTRTVNGREADVGLGGATTTLLKRAETLLARNGDATPVPRSLKETSEIALGLLAAGARGGRADELLTLGVDAVELDDRCHRAHLRRRERLMEQVNAGVTALRRLTSSTELIDAVCKQAVGACDLNRVMLSRIDGGTWYPWMIAFASTVEFDTAFADWVSSAEIPLDDMALETDVLATGRAAIVRVADAHERTHTPVLHPASTRSYVVAPIVPAGRVVGFLHGDYHPTNRDVDAVVRDALWTFAEGFGRVYEHVVILERLRTQRARAHDAFAAAEQVMRSLSAADIELVADEQEANPDAAVGFSTQGVGEIDELLTEREREVLLLMVRGLSNRAIAEQLVIKEGTVKSHVKHILRKVGAVNRTEAISRYLGRHPG